MLQIRAATLFAGPIPHVIHQMKYEGYFALAEPLAGLMEKVWSRWEVPVDLVLPIPLHPERERERGYNQSLLLANCLCRHFGWNSGTGALKRIRWTRPQVGLSATDRQRNVSQAFAADRDQVSGKRLLLIDDVCTTGATLISAANALLAAGAQSVSAYCVARAAGLQDTIYS